MTPEPRRPAPGWLRWTAVWRRNLRVWRKLAGPSLAGNFGEPLLYLLALGYGIGPLVGTVQGLPYLVFLASGIVCSSAMVTASFEGTYSAFSRMAVQGTWEAIITAPLDTFDVVLGEVAWCATKALFNATAIVIVAAALGVITEPRALWALPVVGLAALTFASMAMVVTALARSYDFFLYYTTLCVTPMFLISGVFFPVEQMPPVVRALATALPLVHAVDLVRPLLTGAEARDPVIHLLVLTAWGALAFAMAARLVRRRMQA